MNKSPIGVCKTKTDCIELAVDAVQLIIDYGFDMKTASFDSWFNDVFEQIDWYMFSENPITREQCRTILDNMPNDNKPEYVISEMDKIMNFMDGAIYN